MTKLQMIFAAIRRESLRVVAFLITIVATVWLSEFLPRVTGHPEFAPLFSTIYMILFVVAFSHLARRILFHKLDLQKIGGDAMAHPIGAGLVFFSICLVLCTVMLSYVQLLR